MKTLYKSTIVAFFVLLCSGVFAQTITVDLTINDNSGYTGTYSAVAWVYCTSTSATYGYPPANYLGTNLQTGLNGNLLFTCGVPIDSEHKIYEVKVFVTKDGDPNSNSNGTSLAYTTESLYGINIPVTVNFR